MIFPLNNEKIKSDFKLVVTKRANVIKTLEFTQNIRFSPKSVFMFAKAAHLAIFFTF